MNERRRCEQWLAAAARSRRDSTRVVAARMVKRNRKGNWKWGVEVQEVIQIPQRGKIHTQRPYVSCDLNQGRLPAQLLGWSPGRTLCLRQRALHSITSKYMIYHQIGCTTNKRFKTPANFHFHDAGDAIRHCMPMCRWPASPLRRRESLRWALLWRD